MENSTSEPTAQFEADPYGAAMNAIVNALHQAYGNNGNNGELNMSDGELLILNEIRKVILEEDPSIAAGTNLGDWEVANTEA